MRSLRLVVAVVCVLSVPVGALGDESVVNPTPVREGLLLERGTLELAGGMTFQAQVATSTGAAAYQVILYPSVGYFVADRLELELGAGTNVFPEGSSWGAWFSAYVGARYHVVVGERVTLFAGLRTGLGGSLGEATDPRVAEVWFAAPLGVLVGLNRHVAVELGLQPVLTVWPETGTQAFTASVGYTGVRAYF